jgi:hypothetical protein
MVNFCDVSTKCIAFPLLCQFEVEIALDTMSKNNEYIQLFLFEIDLYTVSVPKFYTFIQLCVATSINEVWKVMCF